MREEVGFGVVRVPRPSADPALSASGQSSHCLQRGSSSYGPLVLMGGVAASIWVMGWVWWVLGELDQDIGSWSLWKSPDRLELGMAK